MLESRLSFPADFYWGTATAAYQIEGAVSVDGRGPSIWDTFSHLDGRIARGHNGDIAADHYHRWQEDIKLMKRLHVNAYRFSISWSRILPTGRGAVNPKGLDFYNRLVDGLLDAGITPFVTLYHWDLPQPLEDEGGWLRRDVVDDFVAYTDVVSRALGDRVKHWVTINEPWVFSWLGYFTGMHAPGNMSGNPMLALQAGHHGLLAHGMALPILRANTPDARVGIALSLTHVDPASDRPEDIAAARRYDGYNNRWYLDALFHGKYPEDMLETYRPFLPEFQPHDLEIIARPMDFLGVNYYTRLVIADEPEQFGLQLKTVEQTGEPTHMGWEVYPDGLTALLRCIHEDYGPNAIYVTENGAAFEDEVTLEGRIHDHKRVDYLRKHLAAASKAIEEGIPLKGYFAWSLLDNFEWAEGYDKRFGLYYVDYATQERTLKDSGRFFAQVAEGAILPTS